MNAIEKGRKFRPTRVQARTRRRQAAVAIAIDPVFDDGAGLRQYQRSIGDDRRFAERMQARSDGGASIVFGSRW